MKATTFQDTNNNEITVNFSSGDEVLITVDGKNNGRDVCYLRLNKRQSNILINAIMDLWEDEE